MAIKGKGKTKARTAARAPRRAPVAVPVPLVRRRWVQVTAAFVVGLGVFWVGIWLTNGLRDQEVAQRQEDELQQQVTAMQRWVAQVEGQVGAITALQDPLPPTLGTEARSAAASIADGKEPAEDPEQLTSQANELADAADTLQEFDLSAAVKDKGFGDRVNTILVSKLQLVEALRLYAVANRLTVAAMEAPSEQATTMAEEATEILTTADHVLSDAWRNYQLVLGQVGLASSGGP
jgi:hypothetical protein